MASLFERGVRRAINRHRADHFLVPVRFDRRASRAARTWARHLRDTDTFVHQDMMRVIRIADAQYAGEMLGRGWVSPRQFGHLWLTSPPHRKVMLNPVYRGIGVAAVSTPHGRLIVVNMVRR